MSRPARLILAAFVTALGVVSLVLMSFVCFAPDSVVYSRRLETGNQIVSSIESFRARSGHLPESLSPAQISDEDQSRFSYESCGDRYVLWFGTTLGKSMAYDSADQKWGSLNIVCDPRMLP
jgi:hypothetical protein